MNFFWGKRHSQIGLLVVSYFFLPIYASIFIIRNMYLSIYLKFNMNTG